MMSDDGGRLIEFPPRPKVMNELRAKVEELDAPIGVKPGEKRYCRHRKVLLDTVGRKVECQECEQVIDPVDFIAGMAAEWDRYLYRWRTAVHGIRHAEEDLADLERKVRNAKARLRKHGGHIRASWVDLSAARRGMYDRVRRRVSADVIVTAEDGAKLAPVAHVVDAMFAALGEWESEEVGLRL